MKPSRVLTLYFATSFILGLILTVPLAMSIQSQEIGMRGAALVTLCWNVLCVMILPLVLDWSEQKHCKARFVRLEEIAAANPELAEALLEQCEKLALPGLKLAVAPSNELFSYGLWGNNPRLIIPDSLLAAGKALIPSIEAELTRFRHQDHTVVFMIFAVVQVLAQQLFVTILH